MIEKQHSSAKVQYEKYREEIEKDKRIFFWQFAEFLLWLPIPMSYEVWSELHKMVDERFGEI